MPRLIDGCPDLRYPAGDSGRGLVVYDHHRRDAVCRVGGQPFGDGRGLDTPPPVPGNEVDDQPEALRHFTPQAGEVTGFERQHAIAGRERVDQRRFPRPGAGRGIDDHRGPDFAELARDLLQRVKPVFGTSGPVVIYPSSGTGAWEAAKSGPRWSM